MFKTVVTFTCNETLLKAKKVQKEGLVGVFIPQCEKDGSFKAKQCLASAGGCYCVDNDGKKISNFTRSHISCECIRTKYYADKKGLIGTFSPQCRHDGTYEPMQCYGSTGQCWCVNNEGKQLSNGTIGLASCSCIRQKYESTVKPLLGGFVPRCEADGTYSPMQTHEGYAWCANSEGIKINNESRSLKACKCPLQQYFAVEQKLLGVFTPKCDADGTFKAMQCNEHNCWCTRPDGSVMHVQAKSLATCTCYRQEELILARGKRLFQKVCF
ncbi:Equistatin [Nymphon striatum]|nr:Equistatin [Nymphon striatum]